MIFFRLPIVVPFSMDSIMKIFFGEDSDTLGGAVSLYGQAFDAAHRCFLDYAFEALPLLSFAKLLPWPLGGYRGLCARAQRRWSRSHREFRRCREILDAESRAIIARCRCDPSLRRRMDLLALFMQAAEAEGSSVARSTEHLRDMVLNFVIAGGDTTACLLSWMFYVLGTHPEVQRRVQAEIDE